LTEAQYSISATFAADISSLSRRHPMIYTSA